VLERSFPHFADSVVSPNVRHREQPKAFPAAAVILCSHNGAAHILEQLESIRMQSHKVSEIHVYDWASQDQTRELVKAWAASLGIDDPAVRLEQRSTAPGAARSFLIAIKEVSSRSEAELLFIADQDDIWMGNKVEVYLQAYVSRPFDLAYSDILVGDANGKVLHRTFYGKRSPYREPVIPIAEGCLVTNPIVGMTLCLNSGWIRTVSSQFERFWIMHDWALSCLCFVTRGQSQYLNTPLVMYRQHSSNLLGAAQNRSIWRKAITLRRHITAIRKQVNSVAEAARGLGISEMDRALTMIGESRARRVKLAMTPLLRLRYRWALAAAFIFF
jgi:glycosyltransferase involved in cell wall biosynthesis